MYPKAELLFPPRLIPPLRDLRGPEWATLVQRIARLPEIEPDSLAFSLMMIRLDGCVKCHEGSFKYMRGCHLCATQTVMQFKGSDEDLVLLYQKARRDIDAYLAGEPVIEEEPGEVIEE
ncbi:MAG: hypothetical protein BWY52_01597 [Chloroflexi bacterium ADurb.Bin325]|nr:MAG: hypothetical protein BWY52_01597 [Chloroflexi bacterium ADurb.Bin325]